MKEKGTGPGLIKDSFSAVHIDDLEQYQRDAVNPSTALAHSLIVGVQQPRLKNNTQNECNESMIQYLEPRVKRPSLHYHPSSHTTIPEYSSPNTIQEEMRQCEERNFLCDSEGDYKNINDFQMKVLTHTYERMLDSVNGTQAVPELKDVLSWDRETVKQTNSIHLELIPEKADCKETILYARSII